MIKEFEIVNATPHHITIGPNQETIPPSSELATLRAHEEFIQRETVETMMGPLDTYEVEFSGLTSESAESLKNYMQENRKFGKSILIVTSFIAAAGARLSDFNVDPASSPISVGWPAMIERDTDSNITGAMRIDTLPSTPSAQLRLHQNTIAYFRKRLFKSETPLPVVDRSAGALTLANAPIPPGNVLEPHYKTEKVGFATPGDVEVAREQLGNIAEDEFIQIDGLTIAHPRALLALMLSPHSRIGFDDAARLVMPYTTRDEETKQKTGAVGAVAVYGPATLERYAEIF